MSQILNRAMLLIAFLAVAYNVLSYGGVRLMDQTVTMGLTIVALVLYAWRTIISAAPPRSGGLAGVLILCFLGYAFVRHQFAVTEYVSRRELIDVALGVAMFFLVLNSGERVREVAWLIGGLLVLGAALSLYAGYQYFAKSDLVWTSVRPEIYGGRGSGSFINPNHFAGFLAMILPLGLALSLSARCSWTMRIIWGYCVLVIISGIVLTFSRGGWIAALAGVLALLGWVLVSRRKTIAWLLLLGMALVMGIAGAWVSRSMLLRERARLTQTEFQSWPISTRVLIWKAAVGEWKENPWWGIGADQFQYRYFEHRDPWLQTNPVRVHNDYLNTLCEYGIVGLSLVLFNAAWLFLLSGRLLAGARRDGVEGERREGDRVLLLAGAGSGLVALAFHSVVDFNLHLRGNLLLAALLMGLLTRLVAEAREKHRDRIEVENRTNGRLMRAGALIVAVLLAAGLGWELRRKIPETIALRQVGGHQRGTDAWLDELLVAAAVESGNPETIMKLGDYYRQRSLLGEEDYKEAAESALQWYERAMVLMPASPFPPMGLGMCLDWLGRHDEAGQSFERMIQLDPNGNRAKAMMGWHYFQIEDYAESRKWIQRSLEGRHPLDSVALNYDGLLRSRGH